MAFKFQKLIRMVLLSSIFLASFTMLGCGFKLRGADGVNQNQLVFNKLAIKNHKVLINTDDNMMANSVKRPLIRQLNMLGFDSFTSNVNNQKTSEIIIENIEFRKYDLVGVLTETRVVILSKVSYKVWQDGRYITHTQPIQVERSYQYNAASVSFEDQQVKQIQTSLYQILARRIADQYVVLSSK